MTHIHMTMLRRELTTTGWVTTVVALVLLALLMLFVADRLYQPGRFQITEIEVHGRVNGEEVKAVVEQSLSGNFFSLSLPRLETRIERLPEVFSASVRRRWPSTLVVEVVEVQPVARWGKDYWLHYTGELVARPINSARQDLPLLSGPAERRQLIWRSFQHWSKMLVASGISLDQLELDARGIWHLEISLGALAGGVVASEQKSVRMTIAQENADARITRFIAALPHQLLGEIPAMRSIDLRYPNGFAISWDTTSPQALRLAETQ